MMLSLLIPSTLTDVEVHVVLLAVVCLGQVHAGQSIASLVCSGYGSVLMYVLVLKRLADGLLRWAVVGIVQQLKRLVIGLLRWVLVM